MTVGCERRAAAVRAPTLGSGSSESLMLCNNDNEVAGVVNAATVSINSAIVT